MTAPTIDDIQHPLRETTVAPGDYRFLLDLDFNGGTCSGTGVVRVASEIPLADVVGPLVRPVFLSCAPASAGWGPVVPSRFAMRPAQAPLPPLVVLP